jgi:hypothetical protein
MRRLRLGTRMFVLGLLGASSFLYAQDAKQQDKPQDDSRPEAKQDEGKPPKQDAAKPPKQDKQDEKMQQQDEKTRDQNVQGHQEMQDHPGQPAAQPAGRDERQGHPAQAGNAPRGRGGHIPDDKFHANFGRSHTFRAQTVIVSGQPQFQYGGYSFPLVDAWPAGWAYTDDCYIDYIDGEYFLFDLLHPGVRIAVIVVM